MIRLLFTFVVASSGAWAQSSSAPTDLSSLTNHALHIAARGAYAGSAAREASTEDMSGESGSEQEETDDDGIGLDAEAEIAAAATDAGILYSQDISDEELVARWSKEPQSLGTVSVGFTEAGRLINAVTLPPGDAWRVVEQAKAWGTQETVDFIMATATAVRSQFPEAPPLRINHISHQHGGYLRPHRSHQAGRDVDLGFYYPGGGNPRIPAQRREVAMDLPLNWALLKALITQGDVQFVLVDKRIQARLYAYALEQGEDKAWLHKLFHSGAQSLVRHARRHKDHFHVRFYSGRSQELGRRLQPLLAKQPEQNLVIHRVKKGDTLGALASRYRSSVKSIQKVNGLTSSALRVGRTLNIPLRGPCTHCPQPPQIIVPPRCLPPEPAKS